MCSCWLWKDVVFHNVNDVCVTFLLLYAYIDSFESIIEFSIKYPQNWGYWDPVLLSLRMKSKVRMKKVHWKKKKREPNCFPHLNLVLTWVSSPGLVLLDTCALSYSSQKKSLVRIKSCKSCELIPSFIQQYPVWAHFMTNTQTEDETGIIVSN